VVAAFDAGAITSDAGALLLSATDRAIRMMDRLASCFHDVRCPELIDHQVVTLVGQRVLGIALLTPTLAITYDSGWIHQNWPEGHASGVAATDVGLKYEAYRTSSTKRWYQSALPGASITRARREYGRTNPTRFCRGYSSARGSVISLTSSPGCAPLPSPERLLARHHLVREVRRSPRG
jgi:hypothetical protein